MVEAAAEVTHSGVHQMGGGGQPALEGPAQQVLSQFRQHASSPQLYARPLTEQERTEAQQQPERCLLCAGIHAGMSTPGCPRLASFKVDGDGKITEGTFWPGTEWAAGRVLFAEDVAEDGEEGGGDGG